MKLFKYASVKKKRFKYALSGLNVNRYSNFGLHRKYLYINLNILLSKIILVTLKRKC